ncbi:HNH endonuclease [Jiangella aurantiaca]|uniref:HNH endonuclease n=1 Tax=Jiangella aurantiaca TaxID=2530373 RepID=A0A4R5AEF9_9ACTN|nr:HNH endonuclease signature motif containing protein [Jiangella aurantiaca]TDD69690.1 HNH endonuclease [Jiangella aurantiaca]
MVASLGSGAGLRSVVQIRLVPDDEPAVRRLDDAVAGFLAGGSGYRCSTRELSADPVPLPGGFESMEPGPELAAALARVPVRRVRGHDTVDVMTAAYRQACHAQAVFLRALLETGMRRAHSGDGVSRVEWPGEFAAEEARAALVWSRRRADSTFEFAWQVHERLPMLGEAMEAGELDEPRARAFVQWTIGLNNDQAAQVITGLLPRAGTLLVGELIDRIKRAAIAIDPGWAERRYRAAVKGRRVEGSRNDDGTANLHGLDLPVDRAAAACDRIDTLARACKHAGDARPTDHIRADLYLGMLDGTFEHLSEDQIVDHVLAHPFADLAEPGTATGGHDGDGDADGHTETGQPVGPAAPRPAADGPPPSGWSVRELRVEVAAMLGVHEHPAEIAGWDVIPATLARPMVASMTNAQWRWVVCDHHGRPIDSGTTHHRPTAPTGTAPPMPARTTGRGRPAIVELQVKADELTWLTALAAERHPAWSAVLADIAGQRAASLPAGSDRADIEAADQHRRSAHAWLRRVVQIRDRCCTHPACRAPASRTDQDHAVDHADGGPTDEANLGSCCRHDHRLKHDGGWRFRKLTPDSTVWTSPLGHTYVSRPPPVMSALPEPWPTAEPIDTAETTPQQHPRHVGLIDTPPF